MYPNLGLTQSTTVLASWSYCSCEFFEMLAGSSNEAHGGAKTTSTQPSGSCSTCDILANVVQAVHVWSHEAVLPSQGNSGSVAPEAAKQNRPTPVVHQEEPVNENLTPPSRILRSGKRVPTGTASKVPPRTASKATRVAALSSDDTLMPKVCTSTAECG